MACMTVLAQTSDDGDDVARARNPLRRSFHSVPLDTQHGTATSAHELGRGHRQKRQSGPPYAMAGTRKLIERPIGVVTSL